MTHLSITILRPLRTRLTVQLRRSNRRSPHLGCHNDRPPGDRRRVRGRCRSTPLSAWTRSFRPGPTQHEQAPRRQDRFPHVTTAPSATHVREAVGKLRHISVPAVHHVIRVHRRTRFATTSGPALNSGAAGRGFPFQDTTPNPPLRARGRAHQRSDGQTTGVSAPFRPLSSHGPGADRRYIRTV